MAASFVFSGDVLTVLVGGAPYQVRKTDPKFENVKKLLVSKASDKELVAALTVVPKPPEKKVVPSTLRSVKAPKVEVRGDKVFYDGKEVHHAVVTYIRKLQEQELPFDSMVRFLERLYGGQTSYRVQNELFTFIEKNGLTINSEGLILAYKAVRRDYKDKHSGTFDNHPGSVPFMERSKVDDDFRVGCSKGLHAGSLQYVWGFGSGDDRIVIVAIDPADVVSVPEDAAFKKMRVCKYTVVADYNGELDKVAYDANSALYAVEEDEEDDDEWLEEFDEDDSDNDEEEIVDDYFEEGEVKVGYDAKYGVKPKHSNQAGYKFHNVRDEHGRFVRG